jgi:hypothetical protein
VPFLNLLNQQRSSPGSAGEDSAERENRAGRGQHGQAALSGSKHKAPGSAGGYLPCKSPGANVLLPGVGTCETPEPQPEIQPQWIGLCNESSRGTGQPEKA